MSMHTRLMLEAHRLHPSWSDRQVQDAFLVLSPTEIGQGYPSFSGFIVNTWFVDTNGDGQANEVEEDIDDDGVFDELTIYNNDGVLVEIHTSVGDNDFYNRRVLVHDGKETVYVDSDGDDRFELGDFPRNVYGEMYRGTVIKPTLQNIER